MQNDANRSVNTSKCLRKNIFMWLTVFIGVSFFTEFFLHSVLAMNSKQAVSGYDLLLKGDDIGDITVTRIHDQNGTMSVQTSVGIEISLWLWSLNLSSEEIIIVDGAGIIQFDHVITEEDKTYHLVGERRNHELWCSVSEVIERQKMDVDVERAASTTVTTIPDRGEVLGIVPLLGEANTVPGELRIPDNLFDTSAAMLEDYLVKNREKMHNRTVRILDTTDFSIETIRVNSADREHITAAGQSFLCHVFNITSSDEQSTSWVAEDSMGPFLVKESGSDEDGSYEIRLKTYTMQDVAQ